MHWQNCYYEYGRDELQYMPGGPVYCWYGVFQLLCGSVLGSCSGHSVLELRSGQVFIDNGVDRMLQLCRGDLRRGNGVD